jgi:hypothetical protein
MENVFSGSGFGQNATYGSYPYRNGFSSSNIAEIFLVMELQRQSVRAANVNRMGAQIAMATQYQPVPAGSAPTAADYNYARACWAMGKIAAGIGYGSTMGTNRPLFLDETCIKLGAVVGQRKAGDLVEPLNDDPFSFNVRGSDLANGIYWTEFENALVVMRLDTTGITNGSVHGVGSPASYSLPSAGAGKKWQRPNAATYVNPDYADLAMQGQNTTLNNGADATSSSLLPMFGEVFLRVSA